MKTLKEPNKKYVGVLLTQRIESGLEYVESPYIVKNDNLFFNTLTAEAVLVEDKKKDALKRPTSFYLPDIHCFLNCDIYEEVLKHLKVYEEILHELQIPYFLTLRISEQEYKQRRIELCNIAKHLNKNILVNIVPSSIKYWESKFKYIYKDTNNEFIQLSTVQVDYRTAKIFDIKAKGENVTIIHSAIGSMERLLYAFLDK